MTKYELFIVGAYYRPPAQAILNAMAVGSKLIVLAEPTNVYDANAIAVHVPRESLPETNTDFEAILAGYGHSYESLCANKLTHVGYIPKEIASRLKANGFPDNTMIEGEFMVSANGKAMVRFEL